MPEFGVNRQLPHKGYRGFFVFLGKPFFLLFVFLAVFGFFACSIILRLLRMILPIFRFIGYILFLGILFYLKIIIFVFSKLHLPGIPFYRLREIALSFDKKIFSLAIFISLFLLSVFWITSLFSLPKAQELATRDRALSTKIYDREGRLLFKIYTNENRTLIPLPDIPIHVQQATIAIEDAEFYNHHGFSTRGILRSLVQNVKAGELSGGSTITQQLVKNVLLSPEKTLSRKAKEVILAIKVESTFTKDQILEMYLNQVPYGGSTYGVEEASQIYFGKSTKELTLSEAALLAGLPRAPTTYSPFGANPQLSRARQLEVLSRMVQEGFITVQEKEDAANQRLVFAPQRTDIKAPHFVMYIKQLLVEKYGERMVEEGGLSVATTLDLGIQEQAEGIVLAEVERIKELRISNGAALVTNPATGEILVMVGSKNYFDPQIDGNFNVTSALRQPGSSIKPVNYSYALESKKYTAASIISDTPITYWIPGSEPYSPRNYDGQFHGNIPLRVALASSFNIPAVKVLASYGVEAMITQGKKLGITTWNDPARFGLSLTLGGGEVKMTDLATVYGTLANYGKRVDLNPILKVTDSKGRILEDNTCATSKVKVSKNLFIRHVLAAEAAPISDCSQDVLDERVAFIITDILRDNSSRTPAFGPNSLLVIPNHPEVAIKTGTTQNLRDNWAIGYTKDFVVAVWVGNNDNTPMAYVASGVTGATPIWHRIMSTLLKDKTNHNWEVPSGIVQANICPITGTLPCEGCPAKSEYFLEGTQPTAACNLQEDLQKIQEEPSMGRIL